MDEITTDIIKNAMSELVSKTILESLTWSNSSTSALPTKPMASDDLKHLTDYLKPKHVIFTGSEEMYKLLLTLPSISEKCLKLSEGLEETIMVDMEKLGIYDKPRCYYER